MTAIRNISIIAILLFAVYLFRDKIPIGKKRTLEDWLYDNLKIPRKSGQKTPDPLEPKPDPDDITPAANRKAWDGGKAIYTISSLSGIGLLGVKSFEYSRPGTSKNEPVTAIANPLAYLKAWNPEASDPTSVFSEKLAIHERSGKSWSDIPLDWTSPNYFDGTHKRIRNLLSDWSAMPRPFNYGDGVFPKIPGKYEHHLRDYWISTQRDRVLPWIDNYLSEMETGSQGPKRHPKSWGTKVWYQNPSKLGFEPIGPWAAMAKIAMIRYFYGWIYLGVETSYIQWFRQEGLLVKMISLHQRADEILTQHWELTADQVFQGLFTLADGAYHLYTTYTNDSWSPAWWEEDKQAS